VKIKQLFTGVVYTLARRLYPVTVFILEHLPMLIPAHRIIETDSLIAFEHPQPAYPNIS
jgi:hypothetical protein